MIRLIINGASGAMGKVLAQAAGESGDYQVVAGVGLDDGASYSFPLYKKLEEIKEEGDLVIDYSNQALLPGLLDYCREKKLPLVIATTGLTDEDHAKIDLASQDIPIVQAGNYSLGINVMEKAVEALSKALADYDIEIVEAHHNKKKDAPSGTALMLYEAANKGREGRLSQTFDRTKKSEAREKTEVGISSIRGGDIVGVHEVIFAGGDEVLTISHRAGSKKIFALGSLNAGRFVIQKDKGRFNMEDVLEGEND